MDSAVHAAVAQSATSAAGWRAGGPGSREPAGSAISPLLVWWGPVLGGHYSVLVGECLCVMGDGEHEAGPQGRVRRLQAVQRPSSLLVRTRRMARAAPGWEATISTA